MKGVVAYLSKCDMSRVVLMQWNWLTNVSNTLAYKNLIEMYSVAQAVSCIQMKRF
jgi:hypothetical protein